MRDNEQKLNFDAIDDETAAILRGKTEAERLAIAHGMWRSAARMIHGMLTDEHPDWTIEQVGRETARRMSHGAV